MKCISIKLFKQEKISSNENLSKGKALRMKRKELES